MAKNVAGSMSSSTWSFTTTGSGLQPPDLQAGGLAVPGSGVAGGTILTDVVITTGGTGDAGPFSVSYLYTQNAPDLSSAIDSGSSCNVPGLAAGADFLCWSVQVNVPLTLAPGTYRVAAVADYADVIEESGGEGNNISISSEITIAPPARTPTAAFLGALGGIGITQYGEVTIENGGGLFASNPAVSQSTAGDTFVAARDTFDALWVNVFDNGTQAWNSWSFVGGVVQGTPAITVEPSGTAYFAALDNWNAYWINSYNTGTGFGGWSNLGGVFATDPAITAAASLNPSLNR